jgi:hypothetical protein
MAETNIANMTCAEFSALSEAEQRAFAIGVANGRGMTAGLFQAYAGAAQDMATTAAERDAIAASYETIQAMRSPLLAIDAARLLDGIRAACKRPELRGEFVISALASVHVDATRNAIQHDSIELLRVFDSLADLHTLAREERKDENNLYIVQDALREEFRAKGIPFRWSMPLRRLWYCHTCGKKFGEVLYELENPTLKHLARTNFSRVHDIREHGSQMGAQLKVFLSEVEITISEKANSRA